MWLVAIFFGSPKIFSLASSYSTSKNENAAYEIDFYRSLRIDGPFPIWKNNFWSSGTTIFLVVGGWPARCNLELSTLGWSKVVGCCGGCCRDCGAVAVAGIVQAKAEK